MTQHKKNSGTLHFEHLPAYAAFLMSHKLSACVKLQLTCFREEKISLLRFFENFTEKQLLDLGKQTLTEFLCALADNKVDAYIVEWSDNYVRNNLPTIERDQVLAEDITSYSFIRKKVLRHFLTSYTTDLVVLNDLMDDIDRFTARSDAAIFNAYMGIERENILRINKELLQKQEELLEAEELNDMGSFLWNIKGGPSSYTPGVLHLFDKEELTSIDAFMTCIQEEDRLVIQKSVRDALLQNGIYECEFRYLKKQKEKRIWSRGLVTFEEGEPVMIKGTVMDISHKYQMVEQLRESEQLNKQAQAITHIGNWTWEMSTEQITWSDELYRIYGLEPQSEIITLERWLSFIHKDDRERRMEEIKKSLQTLEAPDYRMRIITADGQQKVIRGKGEVIVDRSRKKMRLVGTCQDVTKEYNLNKELQEKEDYLKQLINNAPDAVIVTDRNSIISLWNPKTEEIFGWPSREVLGKNVSEVIIPSHKRESYNRTLQRYLETGISNVLNRTMEIRVLNKGNEEFDVSLTISQSMQQGKLLFIAFLRDITKEKQIKQELQNKTQQLENLNASLELKNTELERINEELESFNYVASHDLKEPLRKIQIFAHRILEKGAGEIPHSTVDYFNKIITASARMQLLIEDLLVFSQTTAGENKFEQVNLNDILNEVLSMLSTTIEEKKAVIDSEELPVVKTIPFQMQQLFLNLISNAMKYCREGLSPHICIAVHAVKGFSVQHPMAQPDKEYLEFRVRDNGIGFSEEYAEKIFELFQRLHNKDKYFGTGIGLAICKKILHNHNGFIFARSQMTKGSTFYFYLPKEQ